MTTTNRGWTEAPRGAADPLASAIRADIGDRATIRGVLETHRPDGVINLAAESHVDRSISGTEPFIQTNIVGTFALLKESLAIGAESQQLETELGWRAEHTFETGIRATVRWFLERRDWWEPLRSRYSGERLGLGLDR